ncbi:MAG: hypothetical protein ABI045_05885 [Flavobacteriales bacterium]
MVLALVVVPIMAIVKLGGVDVTFDMLRSVNLKLLNVFKGKDIMVIVPLLAWGLGYFGQRHIIVYFMTIRYLGQLNMAGRIEMGWIFLF